MSNNFVPGKILNVYSALRRELGLLAAYELKKYKFGRNQMIAMIHLDEEESATLSELAEVTQSDPASATRTVNSLEKLGWIKKSIDPVDNRKSVVEITAKGRKKAIIARQIRDHLAAKVDAILTTPENVVVGELLEKIVKGLQESRDLQIEL